MNEMLAIKLLEEYAAALETERNLRADYEGQRAKLIPPEVTGALEDLEFECMPTIELAAKDAEAKKAAVAKAVLELKKTVKSTKVGLQALYITPAPKVNTKKFEGYLLTHEEAKALLEDQDPNVQVRKLGAK
jgi:hypothetical protein